LQALSERCSIAENLSGCCLDCRRSFDVVRSKVLAFCHEIESREDEVHTPEDLYQIYQDLDDLAHLEVSSHLASHILEDPEIRQALPTIRSYYAAFFDHHEVLLAENMLRSKDPWSMLKKFPLYPRYKALIKNQVEAVSLSQDQVLAFLGCGPLPISSILLGGLYGIRSIGLDVDPLAASLARKCIQCLGLEENISIVEGNESVLADLEWDAVLVAALAEPKKRIFQTLRTILKETGPRPICYRTYTGMRAVLYQPVQPEEIKGFRKTCEIAPQGRVNNTLVVLEPEDDADL